MRIGLQARWWQPKAPASGTPEPASPSIADRKASWLPNRSCRKIRTLPNSGHSTAASEIRRHTPAPRGDSEVAARTVAAAGAAEAVPAAAAVEAVFTVAAAAAAAVVVVVLTVVVVVAAGEQAEEEPTTKAFFSKGIDRPA